LSQDRDAQSLISEYEAKIAALERRVGQLTMEVDLLKKTPPPLDEIDSEELSIVSGPVPTLFERGCQVINLPRSTFYYRSAAERHRLPDDYLIAQISDMQDEFPGYGYRRVTRELANKEIRVNHKRIARICAKMAFRPSVPDGLS